MPLSNGSIQIEDYTGERTTVNINLQDVDATGTNVGSVTQDLDEVKDAIMPLILGKVRYSQLGIQYPETSDPVTDKNAQRETKWMVTFKDTTQYLGLGNTVNNPGFGKLFSFGIGTANLGLLEGNEDELRLTAGAGATAKAALEPNIRSPFNRSAAVTPTNEIISIKHVGRNI